MEGISVVDTDRQQRLGPRGQGQDVYVVWVKTDKGATGSFEMPVSDWNKENLEAKLAETRDNLNLAFDI